MAEKRGKKKQARRQTHATTPGWVLLLLGSVVTAIALIFLPRLLKQGPTHFLHIQQSSQASSTQTIPGHRMSETAGGNAHKLLAPQKAPLPVPQRAPTEFDFYTVLPNKRIHSEEKSQSDIMTTDTLPSQRAAGLTTFPAEHQPNRSLSQPTGSSPHPLLNDEVNAQQRSVHPSSVTQSPQNSTTIHSSSLSLGQHYMLQVGAFGGHADAESTKARLALLGIHAHVESASIGEHKTIYRVRIGPYQTSKELSETRQKLADSGVRAIAIELH